MLQISEATAVRVPRVPGHPLKFANGCQAPVLKEASDANKPNFLKNFKFLLIVFAIQLSFFENRAEPWDFFELGTRPLKALEPPLYYADSLLMFSKSLDLSTL